MLGAKKKPVVSLETQLLERSTKVVNVFTDMVTELTEVNQGLNDLQDQKETMIKGLQEEMNRLSEQARRNEVIKNKISDIIS